MNKLIFLILIILQVGTVFAVPMLWPRDAREEKNPFYFVDKVPSCCYFWRYVSAWNEVLFIPLYDTTQLMNYSYNNYDTLP